QIVFLNADVTAVYRRTEAVEQVLIDLQIQVARRIRIQGELLAVYLGVLTGIGDLRTQAENPVLRVLGLVRSNVLNQRCSSGQKSIAERRSHMLEIRESENC